MYSLSIVIPAFNEELRLEATLNKIDAFLKAEDWNAELIVVDDGSIDRTAQLVMRHMPEKPYLRLLQNHINRGKGFSIRRGVEAALGEVILLTDADLSVPLKEAHKLLEAIKRKAARLIFSRQRIERWGFDPEVLMLADRFCFVAKEIGVEVIHDDRSRLNIVSDSFRMFCEVLKIRYHLLFGVYNHPTPSYEIVSTAAAVAGESLDSAPSKVAA